MGAESLGPWPLSRQEEESSEPRAACLCSSMSFESASSSTSSLYHTQLAILGPRAPWKRPMSQGPLIHRARRTLQQGGVSLPNLPLIGDTDTGTLIKGSLLESPPHWCPPSSLSVTRGQVHMLRPQGRGHWTQLFFPLRKALGKESPVHRRLGVRPGVSPGMSSVYALQLPLPLPRIALSQDHQSGTPLVRTLTH